LARGNASVRLRVEVYDALARAKGRDSVTAQARLHDMRRETLHALKAGLNVPRLDTAMRMASDLGTTVDALFERVAA
jgi:DNA-binding XRE family transcriptional regulator